MEIYLDESGTFVPAPELRLSVSVIGALVLPTYSRKMLLNKYEKLRDTLPKDRKGEVKGSLLNERQVSLVCSLLHKNGAIFEAAGIDMADQSLVDIERHRAGQGAAMSRHITDEHTVELRAEIDKLKLVLEHMAPQLYAQSTVASEVICRLLELIPTYFAQRWPRDLDSFDWIIDGKGASKVTPAEAWWSQTVTPMLQSKSLRRPMIFLEGADFTFFNAKYEMATPDHLRQHGFSDDAGVSLNRLMKDNFRFSSDPEPGLEMVDILTNATRRALNGRLGEEGWKGLPSLMIHRREQYVSLLTLRDDTPVPNDKSYVKLVGENFSRGGRSLLTNTNLR